MLAPRPRRLRRTAEMLPVLCYRQVSIMPVPSIGLGTGVDVGLCDDHGQILRLDQEVRVPPNPFGSPRLYLISSATARAM